MSTKYLQKSIIMATNGNVTHQKVVEISQAQLTDNIINQTYIELKKTVAI